MTIVTCPTHGLRKLDLAGPEPMCGDCRCVTLIELLLGWAPLRIRAAAHEIGCADCRVTWTSWAQRLVGNPRGQTPRVRA